MMVIWNVPQAQEAAATQPDETDESEGTVEWAEDLPSGNG